MGGRQVSALERRSGDHLRWVRVVTLAAVLLIHAVIAVLLLALPSRWRWPVAEPSAASPDALEVRFLAPPPKPARPLPVEPLHVATPPPTHAVLPPHRTAPVARAVRATTQATPPAPLRAIDNLIVTAPPGYIAGGGRYASPTYGRQNIRVPGSSEPVHGMPVFRMADPRWQGLAGVVRMVGSHLGAIDPHCLKLDAESNMTTQERLANHLDADDAAQDEAIAARYGCPDPLKPGAAMYYFTHH